MAEFRGCLYVFVDIFREEERESSSSSVGGIFELRDVGEMLWYVNGWAVGRTVSGAYCARTSISKIRYFPTFASAAELVSKKRKMRPKEKFHFVYELDGQKTVVTSLEQILNLDGSSLRSEELARKNSDLNPKWDALTHSVGNVVAKNAMELYKLLDQQNETAARERFSPATYARLWQALQDAGLVEASV